MASNQGPTIETCIQAGKINPLVLGGTSQLDRYLEQLKPGYISVNEKTQAQWLAFTANMAGYLNYYNAQNNIDGTWSAFFDSSLVNYAKVSLEDVSAIQTYFANLLAILQSQEPDYTPQQRCAAFATIGLSIATLCEFINGQLLSAPAGSDYNNRLTDLITNQLQRPLTRLLGYFKGASSCFLTGGLSSVVPPIPLFGLQIQTSGDIFRAAISSPLWFSPYSNGVDLYNSLPYDTSIFSANPSFLPVNNNDPNYPVLVWYCLSRASKQTLFTSVINTFLNACIYIQQYNAQSFTNTLASGQLPPQMALYFTFLTMLEQAQDDLNLFTERHLNFFYEKVLRLSPLPAQPNQAHVTVQIAKDADEYLLPAGTLFNAGKDDTGANVSYSLLQDTVFNQAAVAQLKSFYIAGLGVPQNAQPLLGETDDNLETGIHNAGKAFASPVANSADGMGGAINTTPPSWQAFGNKTVDNNGDVTMLMPLANLGFAIASQYLYLQEGKRVINIQLNTAQANLFSNLYPPPLAGLPFSCQLTTPSTSTGWTTVSEPILFTPSTVNQNIQFQVTLDPDFPPVGGYSTKLNGPSIQTNLPLIQFNLIDDNFGAQGYFAALQAATFTSCVLTVTVGKSPANLSSTPAASDFDGLKTLFLSNNTGTVDASQPFSPFGSPAQAGACLNIGCRELFLKPNAQYAILAEYINLPDYSSPPANTKPNSNNTGGGSSGAYATWLAVNPIYFVNVSPIPPYIGITTTVNTYNTSASLVGALATAGVHYSLPQLTQSYLSNGGWADVGAYNYPLLSVFAEPSTPALSIITSNITPGEYLAGTELPSIDYQDVYKPYSQASTDGFLRLKLSTDFGYDEYIQALTQYRINQSPGLTSTGGVIPPMPEFEPQQPYSPLIKNISINYTAQVTLDLTQNLPGNPFVNYYYIYPFGAAQLTYTVPASLALADGVQYQLANPSQYQSLTTVSGAATIQVPVGNVTYGAPAGTQPLPLGKASIFPAFFTSLSGVLVPIISEFYIGLSNISPGENVNLLFQVVDGSSNPLVAKPKNQITWYYLSNNQWNTFPGGVIDATEDLIQSGIITFSIPLGATMQNTLLPAGYIWIKGTITEYPDAICQLIGVLPQAALVQFVNNNNSPDFLQNQIPAGTISKLVKPIGAIKKIVQPFQSFGGSVAESLQAFWVRVSERLRHKDRAIQIWDYEHMILQQFPTIQKVKCLNHTAYNPGATNSSPYDILYSEQAPGNVTIVTIPYINYNNSAYTLKPYTDVATLVNIKNFILSRVSGQITPKRLHVQNPLFEQIQLTFSVQFATGLDVTYYSGLLNQAIVQFLSPWAFTDQADISFGGIIYKSAIINFIETQSYVEHIINVTMCSMTSDSTQYSADQDAITAANGISILVSAPSHNIIPL